MVRKGATSKDFIRNMEVPGEGMTDGEITGMSKREFIKLVKTSGKISNFTRKMKKKGHTEFSTAWGTKILIDANQEMSKAVGLLEKLQGGINDKEQAEINSMVKARGRKDLRYIA